MIRKIQIKRTTGSYSDKSSTTTNYGEPFFINNSAGDYFALGNTGSDQTLANARYVRLRDYDEASKVPYYNNGNFYVEDGTALSITATSSQKIKTTAATSDGDYYITGVTTTGDECDLYVATANSSSTKNTSGIRFNPTTGVLKGGAWNDYAEYRMCTEQAGICVVEDGNGNLVRCDKICQPGVKIVSDTFGMVIGEQGKSKPVAVAGRVLAYAEDKNKLKIGDAVMSGKNGCVVKMGRLRKILFPECIIGFVSQIPDENYKYNKINIDGRIWISLR